MRRAGALCACCGMHRLHEVAGVVVCTKCDGVTLWPILRRGG